MTLCNVEQSSAGNNSMSVLEAPVLRELDETGSLLVEERQRPSKADGLYNLVMVLGRLSRSLKWLVFHNLRPRNVLARSDIAMSRANFACM